MAIYGEFSHEKWWFSIVMLVYQRVFVPSVSTKHLERFNRSPDSTWLVAVAITHLYMEGFMNPVDVEHTWVCIPGIASGP